MWSNWSGRHRSNPQTEVAPASEPEFVAAVNSARDRGVALRAVGASHSHSRVAATDGVLVDCGRWQGLVSVDETPQRAVFRSGTRIFEIGTLLFEHGLAIKNQGDIDEQSIAGATATGTHGTGRSLQNLSASVCSVRMVLADSSIVTVDSDHDPDLFALARHGLGGVGLITEIGLDLRRAYRLHERLWFAGPDELMAQINELFDATRHFEFFWDPQRDSCAAKSLEETDHPIDDMAGQRFERVGWSHDIISSVRDELHTEMEYSVPVESGPGCFGEIRRLIHRDFPDLVWPIEYRRVAADDLWISAASGRDTVTISVHQGADLDDTDLFAACEQVFLDHGGRPHWGKSHSLDGDDLAKLYPRLARWWAVRDAVDPEGILVTDDLAKLRPAARA